jgi:hypothetical protein
MARERISRKAAGVLVGDRSVGNSAVKVLEAQERTESVRRMACLAERSLFYKFPSGTNR